MRCRWSYYQQATVSVDKQLLAKVRVRFRIRVRVRVRVKFRVRISIKVKGIVGMSFFITRLFCDEK